MVLQSGNHFGATAKGIWSFYWARYPNTVYDIAPLKPGQAPWIKLMTITISNN